MWSTGGILAKTAKWWAAISAFVAVYLLIGAFKGTVGRSIFVKGMTECIIFGWIPAALAYGTARALCYFGADSPSRFRSHNFLMTHEVRLMEKGPKRSPEGRAVANVAINEFIEKNTQGIWSTNAPHVPEAIHVYYFLKRSDADKLSAWLEQTDDQRTGTLTVMRTRR